MKTILIAFFLLSLSLGVRAQMPEKNSLQAGQSTAVNLTNEIDGLLGVQSNDIMQGIQGYGINIGKAIEQKILDEIVSAVADAVVLAPAAEKIMSAYQKMKNNDLATEIDKVKSLAKDALSRQLKIRYQDYKTEYEKLVANARNPKPIKNSVTESVATGAMKNLYGNYVDVADEFYGQGAKHQIMESLVQEHGLPFGIIGTAADLSNSDLMKLRMAIANRSYDPSGNSNDEVASISAYDRIMLKHQTLQEAIRRKAALQQMVGVTRAVVVNAQRKMQLKRYSKTIKLPSQNL